MLNRRQAFTLLSASAIMPRQAFAAAPKELSWDDLLPPGLPYSEIIGEGELDEQNDFWNPIYDENGVKLNEALNGAYIRMPGFIVPLDITADGVSDFLLVPYTGACIHTPPPPPNQLVMAKSKSPWPGDRLWDAVWVVGTMRTQLQSTNLGETGYALSVDEMELYQW
ncbi:MAG: DUF3299 domain-containing protein [Pseudoruegeria sp.]